MRAFARLYETFDQATSPDVKVAAIVDYLAAAPPEDAAWAVFFLSGRKLKRIVAPATVREWTVTATGLDAWLFDECRAVVGDTAETAALMFDSSPSLPPSPGLKPRAYRQWPEADERSPQADKRSLPAHGGSSLSLAAWIEDRLLPLRDRAPSDQQQLVTAWCLEVERLERILLMKLLSGGLRLRVSPALVADALARSSGVPAADMAARLEGEWRPSAESYTALCSTAPPPESAVQPALFSADALEEGRVLRPGPPCRPGPPDSLVDTPGELHRVTAVLLYAQPGRGRSSAIDEYTLALWDQGELVPVAKTLSQLSDDAIIEVDRWIRRHTRERFGPVRHVEPVQVFELGFESVTRSARHRSGVALRLATILRWRKDKKPEEADSLDALRVLL